MISIIVPVYNTEKFIVRCIESIKEQTYKDYEAIIVNDGTKDNSIGVIKDLIKDDDRFMVLTKENGGLSDARNYGIEHSKGGWITFLDSDDYIAPDYLEKSLNVANKYDADISIMGMCYLDEETNDYIVNNSPRDERVFNTKEAIVESLYQKRYSCCAPGKLYKREVIGDIRFPVGRLSEDLAVAHKLLGNAKRVVYISDYGYYYRQQSSSIMHNFNVRRLDALDWSNEIEAYCRDNMPDIERAAICRTFNIAIHFLIEIPLDDEVRDKCIDRIKSEVKRTRIKVIFDRKARNRERLSAILSFFGEKALKKVWDSKIAIKKREY